MGCGYSTVDRNYANYNYMYFVRFQFYLHKYHARMNNRLYVTSSLSNCFLPYIFQASLQVLEEDTAQLWWAGKQLERGKLLKDYVGRNEKTKIVAKLQKKGQGAPGREPVVSEQEQRNMMAWAHKRQEEMKV